MKKKKFAIIGSPVSHSLSPIMHNYWFKKYKIDANYSIIDIKDSELPNIIDKIKSKDLKGINVTLPYKQKIVSHIDLLINDGVTTRSANTEDKKITKGILIHPNQNPIADNNFASPKPIPSLFLIFL